MSENVATLEVGEDVGIKTPAAVVMHLAKAPFSAAEVQEFHAEDRHAGAAIVSIMMAIFAAALIAYTAICFWVIAHPNL